MKKMLSDFKNELQSKYSYGDDLAETIVLAAESVVDYVGSAYEEVVLNALLNCKINVQSTPKRKISEYRKKNSEFIVNPSVEDGKILGLSREINLPSTFNVDSPVSMGTLINSILSLVYTEENSFMIDGDHLEKRVGFDITSYKVDGDRIIPKERIGYGLNAGILSYSELTIMRNDFDSNYEVYGSDYERIIAGYLCDNLGWKDVIIDAMISGNFAEINDYMVNICGLNLEDFLREIDKLRDLEVKRTKMVGVEDQDLKNALEELEQQFKQVSSVIQKFNLSQKEKTVNF